jgi:hypothetical protein
MSAPKSDQHRFGNKILEFQINKILPVYPLKDEQKIIKTRISEP